MKSNSERKKDLKQLKGRKRDKKTGRLLPVHGPPKENQGKIGRPKRSISLVSHLRKILMEQDSKGVTRGHKVMEAFVEACENGKVEAVKELLNRVDGKVADVVVTDASFLKAVKDDELDRLIEQQEKEGKSLV